MDAVPDTGTAFRYPPFKLFLIVLFFIVVSPMYWHRTQLQPLSGGAIIPVAGPAAYANADLYQEIYPAYHYAFGQLRAGKIPLWNAGILCGTPCLANPRLGLFQPLNLVFCGLDTGQALAAHGFLCHVLMGLGMVLFIRSLGLGLLPALGAGVLYAFCGTAAAGMARPPVANTLAWAPFLFWSISEASRRGFSPGSAIGPGLVAALLLVSGIPSVAMAFLLTALGFAVCHLARRPATGRFNLKQRMEWLFLVAGFGLGFSAVQWVPTLAWAFTLEHPGEALAAAGIPRELPLSLVTYLGQLLAPKTGAWPRIAYVGMIPMAVMPAALLITSCWRRDMVIFALSSGLLMVLSIAGPNEWPGVFPWLSGLFPAMLCLSTVFAFGMERFLACPVRPDAPRRLFPLFPVLILWWGTLFYVASNGPRGRLLAALLLLVPLLLVRTRSVGVSLTLLFIGLMFVDLTSSGRSLLRHPFQDAPVCYRVHTAAMAKAELQALDARIGVASGVFDYSLPSNLPMLAPSLKNVGGTWPLTQEQAIWWRRLQGAESSASVAILHQDAAAPRLLNAMSAKAILAGRDSGLFAGTWTNPGPTLHAVSLETPVAAEGIPPDASPGVRVLANNDALPRAFWTPSWREAEGVAAACDLLSDATFNGLHECVVDRESPGFEALSKAFPPAAAPKDSAAVNGACQLEDRQPEEVVLHVKNQQPGITVLTDTWDRGWQATLNGVACPILRVNGLFRGIMTPPGENEIRMIYRPLSTRVGLGVTISALLFAVLVGFLTRKKTS